MQKKVKVCYLFNRCRPREGETKKDDEEKWSPKIPITQSLTRIFTIRVRKHNKLQITNDPGEISLDGIPNGFSESVGSRSEPGGRNIRSSRRRRRRERRRRRFGNIRWLRRGFGSRRRREIGRNKGRRRDGNGNRSAWWTWRSRRKNGCRRCIDEILDLVDVRLGRCVKGYGVAV